MSKDTPGYDDLKIDDGEQVFSPGPSVISCDFTEELDMNLSRRSRIVTETILVGAEHDIALAYRAALAAANRAGLTVGGRLANRTVRIVIEDRRERQL